MKREIVIELEKELDKYLEDMGIKRLYADKPAIIAEIKSAFFAGARILNYIQENKKGVRYDWI